MRIAIACEVESGERRSPLTPADVGNLLTCGLDVVVEASAERVFRNEEFVAVGATVCARVEKVDILFAIKNPGPRNAVKAYAFFTHSSKGQTGARASLERYREQGSSIVDYELLTNESGRRRIGFGLDAGRAAVIDALREIGIRRRDYGCPSPYADLCPSEQYDNWESAARALARCKENGATAPLTLLLGSGNVARGARDALSRGGFAPIAWGPEKIFRRRDGANWCRSDLIENREQYVSRVEAIAGRFELIINGAYWCPGYPSFLTNAWLEKRVRNREPYPAVVADVSYDVPGPIEFNVGGHRWEKRAYEWDARTSRPCTPGSQRGPVVVGLPNWPSAFPREASARFSMELAPIVQELRDAFGRSGWSPTRLPRWILPAMVLCEGVA
jgi:alpha-aminoadipic semialdehyde synthase